MRLRAKDGIFGSATPLPAAGVRLLLHHGGGYGGGRGGNAHSCAGVDDGDGVAGAQGGGLMEFHLVGVGLETGGWVVVAGGGGGEGKAGGDCLGGLGLGLEGRGLGRAA